MAKNTKSRKSKIADLRKLRSTIRKNHIFILIMEIFSIFLLYKIDAMGSIVGIYLLILPLELHFAFSKEESDIFVNVIKVFSIIHMILLLLCNNAITWILAALYFISIFYDCKYVEEFDVVNPTINKKTSQLSLLGYALLFIPASIFIIQVISLPPNTIDKAAYNLAIIGLISISLVLIIDIILECKGYINNIRYPIQYFLCLVLLFAYASAIDRYYSRINKPKDEYAIREIYNNNSNLDLHTVYFLD